MGTHLPYSHPSENLEEVFENSLAGVAYNEGWSEAGLAKYHLIVFSGLARRAEDAVELNSAGP
jgi:hypothetical protein